MRGALVADDGAEMVLIPDGKFVYGISDEQLAGLGYSVRAINQYRRDFHEVFSQDVAISSYYIDKYPVTNEQFERFLKATQRSRRPKWIRSSIWGGPRQPVVGVNWKDATDYARWCGKRLPTEQEWEKAARGGEKRLFPWGNDSERVICNCAEAGLECTSDVGSFPLSNSPYGVQDMAGNVWEMTTGEWEPGVFAMRGGSFLTYIRFCRSTGRWAPDEDEMPSNWLGFRCVRDA
jgi:formylglycine-generating enzyme required for sulfatase activity